MNSCKYTVFSINNKTIFDFLFKDWNFESTYIFAHLNLHEEHLIDKFEDKYPQVSSMYLEGNVLPLSASINLALRQAYIHAGGLSITPTINIVYPYEFSINTQDLYSIGVLDSIFFDQFALLDYLFRLKLKGREIDPEVLSKVIEYDTTPRGAETEWDLVKFGSKWNIPPSTPPAEFWKYLNERKYEWEDSMYAP